jgi:hypothetical protein
VFAIDRDIGSSAPIRIVQGNSLQTAMVVKDEGVAVPAVARDNVPTALLAVEKVDVSGTGELWLGFNGKFISQASKAGMDAIYAGEGKADPEVRNLRKNVDEHPVSGLNQNKYIEQDEKKDKIPSLSLSSIFSVMGKCLSSIVKRPEALMVNIISIGSSSIQAENLTFDLKVYKNFSFIYQKNITSASEDCNPTCYGRMHFANYGDGTSSDEFSFKSVSPGANFAWSFTMTTNNSNGYSSSGWTTASKNGNTWSLTKQGVFNASYPYMKFGLSKVNELGAVWDRFEISRSSSEAGTYYSIATMDVGDDSWYPWANVFINGGVPQTKYMWPSIFSNPKHRSRSGRFSSTLWRSL